MKLDALQHSILFDVYKAKEKNLNTIQYNGNTYRINKISNNENVLITRIYKNFFSKACARFKNLFTKCGYVTKLIQDTINNNKDFEPTKNLSFDGICFSGGGAKGYAYIGVLNNLGQDLNHIKQVSGASIGSLIATFVAIGLSADEIKESILKYQPTKFTNASLERYIKCVFYTALNTPEYENSLRQLFDENSDLKECLENITFSQLEKLQKITSGEKTRIKELSLSASYYNPKQALTSEVRLSAATTPHLPIYKAVINSCAIPLPWIIRKLGPLDLTSMAITRNEFQDANGSDQYDNLLQLEKEKSTFSFLRDGGIHNNVPFSYLEKGKKHLILSFAENKGIYKQALRFSHKVQEWICGEPFYKRRQADHKFADQLGVVYLDPEIGLIDIQQGLQKLDRITYDSSKQLDYYFKSTKNLTTNQETTDPYNDKELNQLKHS